MAKRNLIFPLGMLAMAGAFVIAMPKAHAVCGDVNGDGEILNNDVILTARASIGATTLDQASTARADVGAPGAAADGELLNNDVIVIARKSIGAIEGELTCNESITAGQTVLVPIRYKNGSTGSYKGFQATVSVTGATLQTTTDADLKATKTWNTCKMNANNGKVLCVDTAEKVANSSASALTYIKVTAPQTGSFTVTVADGLQVDTTTGATTTATGLHETLTYTIGQAPPN